MIYTPGRIIEDGRKQNPWNACRQFALLLEWSLKQVSRAEETDKSFIVIPKINPLHRWVQIKVPRDGLTFDLDPSIYKTFIPLYPRLSGKDIGARMHLADVNLPIRDRILENGIKNQRVEQPAHDTYILMSQVSTATAIETVLTVRKPSLVRRRNSDSLI